MQLIQSFDATQYDPAQSVGSLPVGKHPVVIESGEVKATKSNDGGFLQLNLRVIDGPHTGATGAYRLNLYNNNQKAVAIANQQFSAVCHAIGVYKVDTTEQLQGIPFVVEVGLQSGEEAQAKGYTEVKKVFDINGNEPGRNSNGGAAQPQPQQQQPAQQQQSGGWGGQPAQTTQPAQQQQPAWGGQQQQQNGGGQQQQQSGGWQQNGGGQQSGAAPWAK